MAQRTRKFIAAVLILSSFLVPPVSNAADPVASSLGAAEGFVFGKVQKVGFRAFIFRQAIRYNLGGVIENLSDGSVHFVLQGASESLDEALVIIRQGPAKANMKEVKIKPVPFQNGVTSVVLKGWTSTARNFTHPVDLIYPLRADDQPISPKKANRIYKKIIDAAMTEKTA